MTVYPNLRFFVLAVSLSIFMVQSVVDFLLAAIPTLCLQNPLNEATYNGVSCCCSVGTMYKGL